MLSQIAMTVKGVLLLLAAVYGFAALLRPEDAKWVKGAPLKILIGMYLIGMWGHYVWIAYIALMLSIPLLSKSKADAAAIYIIAVISVPVMYYKVIIGSLYLIPFTKYLFAGLGLTIAYFVKRGPAASGGSRFDIPMILVLVLEFASSRDPNPTDMMRQELPVFLNIALPYFVLSRSIRSIEDLRRCVLALALGGFAMALIALAEARFHWLLYKSIEGHLNIGSQINAFGKTRGGVIRAPASFAESTALGNFLAIAGIAVLALKASFASARKWAIALGVIFVGLIAPNSRGAFVGVGMGLLLFDFYRNRWGALAIKVGWGGLIYTILLGLAQFSSYVADTIGKGAATQSSTDYRVLLLRRGMEEIHKHPMLGVNMKTALNNLEDIRQGEHIIDLVNGYITYGLVLGYNGMIGLAMVFLSLCFAMLTARRRLSVNPLLSDLAAFVFAVAGFMSVVSAFTSFGGEGSTYFYEVCAFGSAIWALRQTSLASTVAGAPAPVAPSSPLRAMILADREAARTYRQKRSPTPSAKPS